ncbi:MAG: hypothetical protein JWL74_645, partial [Alphaproteobacteria bacterium]|nr:hypothetical protein [Alphaproteobacteria bacterium]
MGTSASELRFSTPPVFCTASPWTPPTPTQAGGGVLTKVGHYGRITLKQ